MFATRSSRTAKCSAWLLAVLAGGAVLLTPAAAENPPADPADHPADVMSKAAWRAVDQTSDRALAWLARQQKPDGSFKAPPSGQPGITALCTMAFLSRGHLPGQGPYGRTLDRAVQFILSCQKPDGLISHLNPRPPHVRYEASHTAIYNHAVAGVCLAELYGMADPKLAAKMKTTIDKALTFTHHRQWAKKRDPLGRGGWRYIYPSPDDTVDSDLSVVSWQILFMRSAKNAGFKVSAQDIAAAVAYVERCFDRTSGTFFYSCEPRRREIRRAMAGAGILSLSLAGKHNTDMAKSAAAWLLKRPFDQYNSGDVPGQFHTARYHYGVFYASLGLFHLGGDSWKAFYPRTAMTLVKNQRSDGSYAPENHNNRYFGNAYTTALVVIALNVPNQVLPITQR